MQSVSIDKLPKFFAFDSLKEALEQDFDKNDVRKQAIYRQLGNYAQKFHALPDEKLLKQAILAHQVITPLLNALFPKEVEHIFTTTSFHYLQSFSVFFNNGFLEQWKKYCQELTVFESELSKIEKEKVVIRFQRKFEKAVAPLDLSSFIQQSVAHLEQPSLYRASFWQDIQPSVGNAYACTLSIWSYYLWKLLFSQPVFWANAYAFVNVPKQTQLFEVRTSEVEGFYQLIENNYQSVVGNSLYFFDDTVDFSAIDNRIMAAYTPLTDKMSFSPVPLRVVRWATDRLEETGVVAVRIPRIVLQAPAYEGFRRRVQAEFDSVYVVDLDYKNQFEPSKNTISKTETCSLEEEHAVLLFLVRKNKSQYQNGFRLAHLRQQCPVFYWKTTSKFDSLKQFSEALCRTQFQNLSFKKVSQSVNYWIALPEDDFLSFVPLAHKATQTAKLPEEETALFKWASPGLLTARDEWMYDFDKQNLAKKAAYFIQEYESERIRWQNSTQDELIHQFLHKKIKWTAELIQRLKRNLSTSFHESHIKAASYRPFVKQFVYLDEVITHRPYQQFRFFPLKTDKEQDDFLNPTICITVHKQVPLVVHATHYVPDNGYGARATHTFAKYYFDEESNSFKDNITDWALEQFRHHYASKSVKFKAKNFKELKKNLQSMRNTQEEARTITKDAIFAYIYAVLHAPSYRKKYAAILHTELPRIPMYDDFWRWVNWGEKLLDLHLNYEKAIIFPLERADTDSPTQRPLLKADRVRSIIWIDERTYLKNIPEEAWRYRLGVRSAIEWVLEQYRERPLRDKTVKRAQEKGIIEPYHFAKYKEHLIELLRKVCRVSIETMQIIKEMN